MTILAIGRATFDLGYACPRYPAEDGKLSATNFWAGAGGSALNGAVTARALGSAVRLFTMLGAGPFADAVRAELVQYSVPVEDFGDPSADVLPVSSIVVVPGNGTRTIVDQQPVQQVVRAVPDLAVLDHVKVLYCDGFLPELAVPLAQAARARGIPVVLDGGSWKPWTGDLIEHVDHAVVSARFHPHGQPSKDVLSVVRELGPQHVAITQGADFISYHSAGANGMILPRQVEAVDTLGAGDIFHGAYCHYLAMGAEMPEALEQASEVAAHSCRFFGTRAWIGAV
jgi:sugar/nucleoside kinase (ribokinase family)